MFLARWLIFRYEVTLMATVEEADLPKIDRSFGLQLSTS